jgi:uncharacterized protein YcfJ
MDGDGEGLFRESRSGTRVAGTAVAAVVAALVAAALALSAGADGALAGLVASVAGAVATGAVALRGTAADHREDDADLDPDVVRRIGTDDAPDQASHVRVLP